MALWNFLSLWCSVIGPGSSFSDCGATLRFPNQKSRIIAKNIASPTSSDYWLTTIWISWGPSPEPTGGPSSQEWDLGQGIGFAISSEELA